MKEKIKSIIVVLKNIYWNFKIKQIPDGLYLPQKNIKHINVFSGYKIFGASNKEEYEIWQKQACGIIALKMLTDCIGKTKKMTIYDMVKSGIDFGTFVVPEIVNHSEDIKGAFHKGLLNFAKSLGLSGFREGIIPIEKVVYHLYQGWYFLASVNIHDLWDGEWENKYGEKGAGKHIVLVVGFEKQKGEIIKIYYKDCATSCKWNRETDVVNFQKFKNNFNNRGIFLKFPE